MPFPKRDYFTLNQVADRWGTDIEQVKYSIFHDGLEACCWFDRRQIHFYEFPEAGYYTDWLESSYVGIFSEDCRRIFRPGDIHLQRFFVLDGKGAYFRIADRKQKALIHPSEVFVRLSSCREFERRFELIPSHDDTLVIQDDHTYFYNGMLLTFGPMQQAIINILIKARKDGKPWVHTRMLLDKVDSRGDRLRDIFKGNDIWKDLFESDRKGHYRLREDLAIEFQSTKQGKMKKAA